MLPIHQNIFSFPIEKKTNTNLSPEPFVVKRGSDMVTVVEVSDNSKKTSREIAKLASQQENFPNYIPDDVSAMLIFHTEKGVYLFGEVTVHPALKNRLTKFFTPFPLQMDPIFGRDPPNPDLEFRSAVIKSMKNQMFLETDLSGSGLKAQKVLRRLCRTVKNNEGWEEKICVHTDKWDDGNTPKTKCVLTAVKHIECKDTDLAKIESALKKIMHLKKEAGEPLKNLSEFKFTELLPVIANSIDAYIEDDLDKAIRAYDRFGDKIVSTYNDLAIATLAKHGAFFRQTFAKLNLSSGEQKPTEINA